jgi:hypothetical protein
VKADNKNRRGIAGASVSNEEEESMRFGFGGVVREEEEA